jgi:hypothetical protein
MNLNSFCINEIQPGEVVHFAVIMATTTQELIKKLTQALEDYFDCVVFIDEAIDDTLIDNLILNEGISITVTVYPGSKEGCEDEEDFKADIELLPTYIY